MVEGGRQAVSQEEGSSPLPAGYGPLDAPAAPASSPPPALPLRRAWSRLATGAPTAPSTHPEAAPAEVDTTRPAPPPPPAPVLPPTSGGPSEVVSPAVPPRTPRRPAPRPAAPAVDPTESVAAVAAVAPVTGRRAPIVAAPRPYGDPTSDVVEGPVRGRLRPHRDVRVIRGVRTRRLVRRIDVWTVFKVSVVFYLLVLLSLVVAGVVVWNVAQAFGLVTSIEKSVRTLFSLKTFVIHPIPTLEYGAAVGAVLCVFGSCVNTLVAAVYNLISDVVGGVQVVVVSEVE